MSLDSAALNELWRIFDASNGDLRPEYLIPLMFSESHLNPAADNGVGFYGINQLSAASLPSGVTPDVYKTWSAAQQLRRAAGPFFLSLNRAFGPARSGTRAYQMNFVPKSMELAFNFEDVIVAKGGTRYGGAEDSFYKSNAANLDFGNKGKITVGDMAHATALALAHPTVDIAITRAYALRGEPRPGVSGPSVGLPMNPVYGTDFDSHGNYIPGGRHVPTPPTSIATRTAAWGPYLLAVSMVAATGAALWYVEKTPSRKRRRR